EYCEVVHHGEYTDCRYDDVRTESGYQYGEQKPESIYLNIEIHTDPRHELHCFMYHLSIHHPGNQGEQIDDNQEWYRQDEPAQVYTSVIPVERADENGGNDRQQNRQMY